MQILAAEWVRRGMIVMMYYFSDQQLHTTKLQA